MARLKGIALEWYVPVLVIVVWWTWSEGAESFYFPPMAEITAAFADVWLFERFTSDVVPSIVRFAAGYTVAALVGIPLGGLLGCLPTVQRAVHPVAEFLRALPPPVIIPFGMLVLGVGERMKIFVIFFGCLWPILLNAIDGVRAVDTVTVDMAKTYRVRPLDQFRFVYIPAAGPRIVSGMRTALSIGLALVVISEMVASTNGLGYFTLQSQRSFAIPEMWSGILLLGLIGYATNILFLFWERRVLKWHRGARRQLPE